MNNPSLFQIIGAIGLDGQDVKRMTLAKRGVLMAAKIAKGIDEILDLEEEAFIKGLEDVKKTTFNNLKGIEKELVASLSSDGILIKKKSLLSCDMNYYTAGVEIEEYFTNESFYRREVEELRAELLEEGKPSLEAIILFVLVKESGIIHDIFSQKEQTELSYKIKEVSLSSRKFEALLDISFINSLQYSLTAFVKGKRNLFKNPYLEGVALIFPFLDRRVSIFIDTIILGSSVRGRREAVLDFLLSHGFEAEDASVNGESLIRVDNSYYSLWPAVRSAKFPIQGVSLVPYYF